MATKRAPIEDGIFFLFAKARNDGNEVIISRKGKKVFHFLPNICRKRRRLEVIKKSQLVKRIFLLVRRTAAALR